MSDVAMTLRCDGSGPELAMACVTGRRFDRADIDLRLVVNGESRIGQRITLIGAVLKAYSFKSSADGHLGKESIRLGYSAFHVERPVFAWDGTHLSTSRGGFGCMGNVPSILG